MIPKLKTLAAILLAPSAPLYAVDSTFDVDAFAQGSFEGEGDTRRFQHEPKEYNAIVMGPWKEKTKLRTTDKGQLILDVLWQVDDPEQMAKHNLERLPPVRQSIFLDLTPAGALDMGPFKNPELNKLRAVFGLNKPGVRWTFQDFIGKPAKVKVEQRPNAQNPQDPFTNVTAVTAL
jgi:hypothetical protein